jgi:hypothetical protein
MTVSPVACARYLPRQRSISDSGYIAPLSPNTIRLKQNQTRGKTPDAYRTTDNTDQIPGSIGVHRALRHSISSNGQSYLQQGQLIQVSSSSIKRDTTRGGSQPIIFVLMVPTLRPSAYQTFITGGSGKTIGRRIHIRKCEDESAKCSGSSRLDLFKCFLLIQATVRNVFTVQRRIVPRRIFKKFRKNAFGG